MEKKVTVKIIDVPYIDRDSKKLITKKDKSFTITQKRFDEINQNYKYLEMLKKEEDNSGE